MRLTIPSVLRTSAVAAAAALLGGCIPQVTHGPTVHPGLSGGGALTVGVGDVFGPNKGTSGGDEELPAFSIPGLQLNVRQGAAHGPFGPPAHIGLQLQPFSLLAISAERGGVDPLRGLTGGDVDLYTQLAAPVGAPDRGVGVLLGPDHVSPYWEYGRPDRGNGGWFTVQQLAAVRADRNWLLVWGASLFGTEGGPRGKAAHLGLTGQVGRMVPRAGKGGTAAWFGLVVATVSLDFFRAPAPQ